MFHMFIVYLYTPTFLNKSFIYYLFVCIFYYAFFIIYFIFLFNVNVALLCKLLYLVCYTFVGRKDRLGDK